MCPKISIVAATNNHINNNNNGNGNDNEFAFLSSRFERSSLMLIGINDTPETNRFNEHNKFMRSELKGVSPILNDDDIMEMRVKPLQLCNRWN